LAGFRVFISLPPTAVLRAAAPLYERIRWHGEVADAAIRSEARKQRRFGSRDRRTLREVIFVALRYDGTVSCLLEGTTDRCTHLRLAIAWSLAHSLNLSDTSNRELIAQRFVLEPQSLTVLSSIPEREAHLKQLPIERQAREYFGLPHALAVQLLSDWSHQQCVAFAHTLRERAPLVVRANRRKVGSPQALAKRLADEGIETSPCRFARDGLVVHSRLQTQNSEAFAAGLFEVQDEGSQLLAQLAQPSEPGLVIDACAGAGGKALALVDRLPADAPLLALDIGASRLERLGERARRAGTRRQIRTQVIPADAAADSILSQWSNQAQTVLVDAPCSGLGTLRRAPDLLWRFDTAHLPEITSLQGTLLGRFAPLVRRGGFLVYGTCSVLTAENQDVVHKFLTQHPDFEVVPASSRLPDDLCAGDFLSLSPQQHNTDGFFGALLRKKT
jgi:16S rRNA (cytosine967-C5)-methyltransferase